MKLLITGATGFVGRALCLQLFREGHELLVVSRKKSLPVDWGLPSEVLSWDPTKQPCPRSLDDIDGLVHLMGESVAESRWTPKRRKIIVDSRALATQRVVDALRSRSKPLECLISASAIGFYPYDGVADLVEESQTGKHFLAEVCQQWEAPLAAASAKRTLILRCGMVLGADGGAFAKLRPLFAAGLGGRLGSGQQVMSWIHRTDLIMFISQALRESQWSGVYNCVSPFPVSNQEFTRVLSSALAMPAILPVPSLALKLVFGEMSDILLKSQKVRPKRLLEQGFTFRYPRLTEALAEVCSLHEKDGRSKACHRLESQQFVARPLPEVFDFFCDPHNLERITPPLVQFKIESMSTPQIQEGTIIRYRLKLHGIPVRWKTKILSWKPREQFVDNQEKGPYAIWYHTHKFEAVRGGTLMTDQVKYRVPLGCLGELFALPWVRMNVRSIFAYRREVIGKLYP